MTEFSNIVLTQQEEKAFSKFDNSHTARLTENEFVMLRDTGLIQNTVNGKSGWFEPDSKGRCHISRRGLQYQAYRSAVASELKQVKRHDWTIAIFGVIGGAVAGLVMSLVLWLITSN